PEPGAADHVLWLEEDETSSAYAGRFVLMYHVLWELTHVCFEHPGLLEPPEPGDVGEVCVTCSDEGRLGEVVAVGADDRARVRTAGGLEAVDTSLIGAAHPGDLVLIHAGSAVTVVEEAEG
ncbi:MAG: HypC/HybG/HupF family hydrogenase formation chaperone, partial [Acidimicrobiales bacterium]